MEEMELIQEIQTEEGTADLPRTMTDSRRFSCTLCGECCSGTMEVFLNPYDLYKMGRFLNMSHSIELFEKKLIEWAPGQNSLLLPKIRFKTEPFSFCPFLINDYQDELGLRGLCSLHPEHKPLVCHLAPLTRQIDLETGEDSFGFIPPHPDCPGCGRGEEIREDLVRKELKSELAHEMTYYQILSDRAEGHPEKIRGLFLFDLNKSFSVP
ncbi:MAG: hypothetical protein B6241_14785 [Spirochaetaceae bacterium 4572_59]|nr:MAG: hypothetical protein B6241_14785 [Spirochaetaceae bacterium 4572_59]